MILLTSHKNGAFPPTKGKLRLSDQVDAAQGVVPQGVVPDRQSEVFESNNFERFATHGDALLYYNELVRDLENDSGAENHLTLLFEDGLKTNMCRE